MRSFAALITLTFVSFYLFFFVALPANSQDLNFQSAFENYLGARDSYNREYSEFQKARDFYLATKTLVQKENVRRETYEMLISRDDLMSAYLTAIWSRLYQTPGGGGNEKSDILSDLVGEIDWYKNHKSIYNQDLDTLETLFDKSKGAKKHHEETTSFYIYETLATIAFSKYRDTKTKFENIYQEVKSKTEGAEGNKKALYDRWIADIDRKFQEVTDIEVEIKEIIEEFRSDKRRNPDETYRRAIAKANEAKDAIVMIGGFLSELLVAVNSSNGQ
ncbi:hypothetical protein HYT59_02475 [Candidatus Woesebacteria bacterium]|nr:hypothetical protein [Candidatus Woesebacteria bacterium]